MANIEKVSVIQVILLLVNGRLLTEMLYQPAVKTPPANQDMWITEILALIYLFIICMPLLFLSNKFENMTLVQYVETIMGKVIGKLLGLLFIAILLLYTQLQLALAAIFLKTIIIPETPEYATMLLMLTACTYAAYKGLECLGRLAEFFVPFYFIIIILFFVLSSKDMKFEVFLPILADTDFGQLNFGALNIASRYTEIIILSMLVPHINKKKHVNTIFAYSTVIFTFLFLMATISTQSILGIAPAKEENFPYFIFVKQIRAFDFIERIESLNVLIWFLGWFLKFSLYQYFAAASLAQILGRKSHKIFIIVIAALMFIIAVKSEILDIVMLNFIGSYKVLPYIGFVPIFIIPLVVLAVYYFRRKNLIISR